MIRKACALLAIALCAATTVAAQTPKPKTPAPAPKAAAARPAVRPAAFDARDPASLVALLISLEAKAEIAGKSDDGVLLKVTSPAGAFQGQFAGCNAQGRACAAVQFEAPAAQRTATLAEINGFNQSSLTCRIFQDRAGKPHMLYSTLLFAGDTRQEMLAQVGAWQGCLANFGAFLNDPAGYLASAP
jgi:hypothetical protein